MTSLRKPMPWIVLAVALFSVLIAATTRTNVHAQMQEPAQDELTPMATGVTPYAEFQYATLTGSNNTLVATNVPVVTASGTTYKNITFQVNVSTSGAVTIASGSPSVVASPTTQAAGFKAGTYVGPSNIFAGKGIIVVSGPGVTAGGATVWSMATGPGANYDTRPTSANWYVGLPTAANNPMAARLKKAGITSSAYSYGILSNVAGYGNQFWINGAIVGVLQSGNAITFASFTSNGATGTDYSTPQDQLTFTWKSN